MSAPRLKLNLVSSAVKTNIEKVLAASGANVSKLVADIEDEERETKETKKKPIKKGVRHRAVTPEEAPALVKSVHVSPDKNTIKIILALNPNRLPTAQHKGVFTDKQGRVHFFTQSHIRKAEKTFELALAPYAHLAKEWGRVPVEFSFLFLFSYPSGTPKREMHKIGPMDVAPDVDNIYKGVGDAAMRAGFCEDDKLVNNLVVRKRRTTGPACVVFTVTNLQPKFEALYKETEAHESPTLFNNPSEDKKPSETNPLSEVLKSKQGS